MERQSQAKHKNRDERLTIRFTNEEKAEILEKANELFYIYKNQDNENPTDNKN